MEPDLPLPVSSDAVVLPRPRTSQPTSPATPVALLLQAEEALLGQARRVPSSGRYSLIPVPRTSR